MFSGFLEKPRLLRSGVLVQLQPISQVFTWMELRKLPAKNQLLVLAEVRKPQYYQLYAYLKTKTYRVLRLGEVNGCSIEREHY